MDRIGDSYIKITPPLDSDGKPVPGNIGCEQFLATAAVLQERKKALQYMTARSLTPT